MKKLSKNILTQCRERLIEAKADILNRARTARQELFIEDRGGDEADQTFRLMNEREVLNQQERLRMQLIEIEMALGRIDAGTYGVCEETEESIEVERLLAIPWTRLSIEGAEMRESMGSRYAR